MKRKYRAVSVLLILTLAFSICVSALAAEPGDTIVIDSVDDWRSLAKSCSLDIWSQGKTVLLEADLDFSGSEFTSIPTFGGTFDGQGHKITGLSITGDGSIQGLFRYVQASGVVRNLTVEGSVTPSGSKSKIGGIVGSNSGQLTRCTFQGSVKGKNIVGGIAGINEASGQLINCDFSGIVIAEHYAGGIAGQNMGSIVQCTNSGSINTTEVKVPLDIEDFNWQDLNSTENAAVCVDIGGIAGYSAGIMQSCRNTGVIGYEHVGYNIGGIVGRQAGYINGCTNNGAVYGRKDVGGIAGQAEPDILLRYNETTLSRIYDELDVLTGLIDRTISHAEGASSDISSKVSSITESTGKAKDAVHSMTGSLVDWANGSIGAINDLTARVSWALGELVPVIDGAREAFDILASMSGDISAALEDGEIAMRLGAQAAADLKAAGDDLLKAFEDAKTAMGYIDSARGHLQAALGDTDAVNAAMGELAEGVQKLSAALGDMGAAMNEISDILAASSVDYTALVAALSGLAESFGGMSGALSDISGALGTLLGQLNAEELSAAMEDIGQAIPYLQSGIGSAADAVSDLRNALAALEQAGKISADMLAHLRDASNKMGDALSVLSKTTGTLKKLVSKLAEMPTLEFNGIDSNFTAQSDVLNQSLGEMLDGAAALGSALSAASSTLLEDMRAINSQISVIISLMRQSLDDDQTADSAEEYEDVSGENLADERTTGKITGCVNAGTIQGDVNVGGITGSMAIEYDFDPEDDLTPVGTRSYSFQLQTLAVVKSCVNQGSVLAKKDCSGGIVGRMDLGAVSSCEGYGAVESVGGSYVGGIAGASYSAISGSFAKCVLSGGDHVGGIAGLGYDIKNCYTLIQIDAGTEALGAIAGWVDGEAAGNYFVHHQLAAIDGISYAGKAEPISYESLLALDNLPYEFSRFYLTFTADGAIIATIPFSYGDSMKPEDLPSIPPKAGYSAGWPDIDLTYLTFSQTLEAIYTPYSSALAGENEVPEILVSGSFSDAAEVEIMSSEADWTDSGGNPYSATAYTVRVADPAADSFSYTVRFRLPEDAGAAVLWVQTENGWQQRDYETDGSYLLLDSESGQVTFCVTEREANRLAVIIIAACVLALLVIVAVIRHIKKKRSASLLKSK